MILKSRLFKFLGILFGIFGYTAILILSWIFYDENMVYIIIAIPVVGVPIFFVILICLIPWLKGEEDEDYDEFM